jgi:extracellular factor (EF) 3-hydroxypalmitic acid methyl ester biosynthesis protein
LVTVNKRFVMARKMFHPVHGMSKVLNRNGNGNGANGLLEQPPKKAAKPPAVAPSSDVKESQVTFQTVEGVKLRGTPVRVTRHAVVFELYNPNATPRLSEALGEFQIVLQGRTIYSGRAVVSKAVDAGTKVVCEVTLDESSWTNLNLALALGHDGELAGEFKNFLNEWQKFYKVRPEFKVVIADLQTFLGDLRAWLDHVEIAVRSFSPAGQTKWGQEIACQLESKVVPAIQNLTEPLEDTMNCLEPDLVPVHRAFCRRLLHPMTLCSPFIHRAYQKPLGYAGDYEMVNMMFREPFEGESLFAKMINAYALQLPPIIGHRNRIHYLGEKLEKESLRVMVQHRDARVFNMGCGPAQEIQRFLIEDELANYTHFTLADFNQETLEYTARILGNLKKQHRRRGQIQMVERSVYTMLKEAGRIEGGECVRGDRYDLIFCAGLFDYLSDQVCRQLMEVFYAMLLPGGLLIATNVDNHPAKNQMECFLDWHLVHRNTDKMRLLAPPKVTPDNISIKRDPSGVNVFMEIRKSNGE